MSTRIPWDQLRADTLRLVCRDFGAPPRKLEDMLAFLTALESQGLEAALKDAKPDSFPQSNVTGKGKGKERASLKDDNDYTPSSSSGVKQWQSSTPGDHDAFPSRQYARRPRRRTGKTALGAGVSSPRSSGRGSSAGSGKMRMVFEPKAGMVFEGVFVPRLSVAARAAYVALREKAAPATDADGGHVAISSTSPPDAPIRSDPFAWRPSPGAAALGASPGPEMWRPRPDSAVSSPSTIGYPLTPPDVAVDGESDADAEGEEDTGDHTTVYVYKAMETCAWLPSIVSAANAPGQA